MFATPHPSKALTIDLPMGYMIKKIKQSFLIVSFLGFLVLSSAIGVVYLKHLYRHFHTQLQDLRDQRDKLHIEWTQLLLEQSALASDMRVEQIARDELGMIFPAPNTIEMIRP